VNAPARPETWATRLARWRLNLFPCYWGTGASVTFIAGDWHEVRVRLPLTWRTRNVVGTIFGGSLYGAVDPLYMLMFMHLLGPKYVVWDEAAAIRFLKAGRSPLGATFTVSPAQVTQLRADLAHESPLRRTFQVCLVDSAGAVHVEVDKTLYFRRRD
jgi:acyl-coenzyme A thioesterase PaaI-like protein